ncbi:hypothetical protein B0H14DRAFT_3686410 [Mycena olivaceomarginata]|nr:hypothetical protein B0H14DRAFT_3686410 [Mycena olivaceomarginata]
MAITETQKSRTIRARVKNPPALSKPRAKPGPKPKNGPHTAARFERDERRRDLMYHNWTEVFDYMEDNKDDSQRKVVAYFATRLDAKGGKLFFTQSALNGLLALALSEPAYDDVDYGSPFLQVFGGLWMCQCPGIPAFGDLKHHGQPRIGFSWQLDGTGICPWRPLVVPVVGFVEFVVVSECR